MKGLLLSLLFWALSLSASAREAFSYLYIQGDKQTPFYVKLDDAMQPRYGKNYCILSQLAPGTIHIEILFQQNAFPAQKFTVRIPESGNRGFLLVKKEEGFALYDLQQRFYLPAGNAEADDHIPATQVALAQTETPEPTTQITQATEQQAEPQKPKKEPAKKKVREKVVHKTATPKETAQADSGPRFIPGMELSKEHAAGDSSREEPAVPMTPAIVNSDCPSAISTVEFKKIFNEMAARQGDEDRLAYILGKLDVCYESWQARALAQILNGEAARLTLLKRIYPRISDQAAFPLLDDLFSSDVWKAEFAKMVRH